MTHTAGWKGIIPNGFFVNQNVSCTQTEIWGIILTRMRRHPILALHQAVQWHSQDRFLPDNLGCQKPKMSQTLPDHECSCGDCSGVGWFRGGGVDSKNPIYHR